MQSDYIQHLSQDTWLSDQFPATATATDPIAESQDPPLTHFSSHFVGEMTLNGDAETVTQYLNQHQDWFCRCAQPMTAEPVGDNGYLITVGHYGSHGFMLEPKVGLRLLPPDPEGVYYIETFEHPAVENQAYQVDFKAAMKLLETAQTSADAHSTSIEWTLDLGVSIRFPRFVQRLPQSLIQSTGDRILKQIVRQVSRRLTAKVQDDFHCQQSDR